MTRVVLLMKDFELAKTRLSSVLDPAARRSRRELRARGARRRRTDARWSWQARRRGQVARGMGNEVVVEERAGGQNPAARLGIEAAVERGRMPCCFSPAICL